MRSKKQAPDATRSALLARIAGLGTVGLGLGWVIDARRRGREAHRLHRVLVDLLLNALHSGDPRTERHSRRVADLTDVLAHTYGLDERRRARLRVAALLHDLGKIDDGIFEIVHSRDRLSPGDRAAMQCHPHTSADILRPLEKIHPGIGRIVESHHESWDGSGYPKGLRGTEIPLEARIMSAADVFDAMSQPRAYREPNPIGRVLEQLKESAGSKFDPQVIRRVERPDVLSRWAEIAGRGKSEERREEARADAASI